MLINIKHVIDLSLNKSSWKNEYCKFRNYCVHLLTRLCHFRLKGGFNFFAILRKILFNSYKKFQNVKKVLDKVNTSIEKKSIHTTINLWNYNILIKERDWKRLNSSDWYKAEKNKQKHALDMAGYLTIPHP